MTDFSLYQVDLDTPQPNGRKGESPRASFTKYNDFLAQLGGMIETIAATPPVSPIAYQSWIDISVNPAILRRRNAANTDWVAIGPALQALGALAFMNEDDLGLGSAAFLDAAGEFGSAAFVNAIGSAPLYGRDSVVGTVGQDGGVPTGAVVQYGSNPNGEFVRLVGGLQICRATVLSNSSGDSVWAYPARFQNGQSVGCFGSVASSNANSLILNESTGSSATSFVFRTVHADTKGLIAANTKLTAVGWWS